MPCGWAARNRFPGNIFLLFDTGKSNTQVDWLHFHFPIALNVERVCPHHFGGSLVVSQHVLDLFCFTPHMRLVRQIYPNRWVWDMKHALFCWMWILATQHACIRKYILLPRYYLDYGIGKSLNGVNLPGGGFFLLFYLLSLRFRSDFPLNFDSQFGYLDDLPNQNGLFSCTLVCD